MKRSPMLLTAGLLMLLGPIGSAVAQTPPADVAGRWGLIGTWKVDCAAPTSRANPAFTYVVRDGKLHHDSDFGDTRDSDEVRVASIERDGSLKVLIHSTSPRGSLEFTFVKDAGGRTRLVYITDFATGWHPSPERWQAANPDRTRWQTRCR